MCLVLTEVQKFVRGSKMDLCLATEAYGICDQGGMDAKGDLKGIAWLAWRKYGSERMQDMFTCNNRQKMIALGLVEEPTAQALS